MNIFFLILIFIILYYYLDIIFILLFNMETLTYIRNFLLIYIILLFFDECMRIYIEYFPLLINCLPIKLNLTIESTKNNKKEEEYIN